MRKHTFLKSDFNYNLKTSVNDVMCTCKTKVSYKLKMILPIPSIDADSPVICYSQCMRILFTAFLRQMRLLPETDQQCITCALTRIRSGKDVKDKYGRPFCKVTDDCRINQHLKQTDMYEILGLDRTLFSKVNFREYSYSGIRKAFFEFKDDFYNFSIPVKKWRFTELFYNKLCMTSIDIGGDVTDEMLENCKNVRPSPFLNKFNYHPQLTDSVTPADHIVQDYHKYCDHFFITYIEPLLVDFNYDVEEWMQHLATLAKQNEVLGYYVSYLKGIKDAPEWHDDTYTLFAKSEKQAVEYVNDVRKMPKCRAISACPPNLKWIMGPVVYALEKLAYLIPGYKTATYNKDMKITQSADNWQQHEDTLEFLYSQGLTSSIDIDGSAWDSTQSHLTKYLVNKIYHYLHENNKIYHVDSELFYKLATKRYRRLIAKVYLDGRSYTVASAMIDGTTFSGSMDTTFANTITNLSIHNYIQDRLQIPRDRFIHRCSGDDYNGLIDPYYADKRLMNAIEGVWYSLNLLPKYVKVGGYDSITFCSTNVIPYKEDGIQKFKITRQFERMYPLSHFSMKAHSYSYGQMKTYYTDLAIANAQWAHDMPFYGFYTTAYHIMASAIKDKPKPLAKPGKPKLTFKLGVKSAFKTHEEEIQAQRVSNRRPDPSYVYAYLFDKFGLTKTNVDDTFRRMVFDTVGSFGQS